MQKECKMQKKDKDKRYKNGRNYEYHNNFSNILKKF